MHRAQRDIDLFDAFLQTATFFFLGESPAAGDIRRRAYRHNAMPDGEMSVSFRKRFDRTKSSHSASDANIWHRVISMNHESLFMLYAKSIPCLLFFSMNRLIPRNKIIFIKIFPSSAHGESPFRVARVTQSASSNAEITASKVRPQRAANDACLRQIGLP